MITKGKILAIDLLGNTCTVRIPYFESANDGSEAVLSATFSNMPGMHGGYQIDDTVFVAFEDGRASYPVVIGKLFTGTANESNTVGSILCADLAVSNSATLPLDTRLTANNVYETSTPLKGNIAEYKSLYDIVDKLRSIENNIEAVTDGLEIYSNKEQLVGKWLDKPLYRRVLEIDATDFAANLDAYFIDLSDYIKSELDYVTVDLGHSVQITNKYINTPHWLTSTSTALQDYWQPSIRINSNTKHKVLTISHQLPLGATLQKYYIVIEYTK